MLLDIIHLCYRGCFDDDTARYCTIPLDFIDLYFFECPVYVRYSNLVLSNISKKKIIIVCFVSACYGLIIVA